MYRTICYFLSLLTVVLIALGYLNKAYQLGFPDGNITDYEYVSRTLFYAVTALLVLFLFYFIYAAKLSLSQNIKKPLLISIVIQCLLLIGYFVGDWYLYNLLDHGQGG